MADAAPASPRQPGARVSEPARLRRLPVLGGSAEPPVRGQAALEGGDGLVLRLSVALSRTLRAEENPLTQSGAITTVTFLVAVVSGIVLLFWYSTSVHGAYDSVAAMTGARWTSGFVRTLHRYSSDACMLFASIHAGRLLLARRVGGARWLAWVTGLLSLGLLWFIGWIGYWLVWDERGERVARASARMLDVLPVFADPMSRSLLVDAHVSSLTFFVVFFVHMLLPLAMGVVLFIHIKRLARPEFLTRTVLSVWVGVSLCLMSWLLPADLAEPARMTESSSRLVVDGYYLLPLVLTDRVGPTALWAVALALGLVLFSLPWWLVRPRGAGAIAPEPNAAPAHSARHARPAYVEEARCNACEVCVGDCPYNAITMQPRTDDSAHPARAFVDPSLCVGCGICAGSCDSAGIGLGWNDSIEQRHRLDRLLESHPGATVAFLCAEGAGATLTVDDATGRLPDAPDVLAMGVPCAGWVHSLLVERALRRGAARVVIAACAPGECRYREGGKWSAARLAGERRPELRPEKAPAGSVTTLALGRHEAPALLRALRDGAAPTTRPTAVARWALGGGLAIAFSLFTYAGSVMPISVPDGERSHLTISFKRAGMLAEQCVEPPAEELAKRPIHMRQAKQCDRRRTDVRLRVTLDDRVIVQRAFAPGGLWRDSASVALERVELPPGEHRVRVELGDTPDDAYGLSSERVILTRTGRDHVVLLGDDGQFEWHP
ncbi:MAG: hydrogenase iron-sulfur subunit [Polyangiaceae bacterium]|nr:hydrogenase iron-sulfur subunit [Polyangiaceae bacterium]